MDPTYQQIFVAPFKDVKCNCRACDLREGTIDLMKDSARRYHESLIYTDSRLFERVFNTSFAS